MIRVMMIGLLLMGGQQALAQEQYPSGVSSGVEKKQADTLTAWLLEQQRHASASVESELPTPLYVESQNRLVSAFRQPIPESLSDRASSRKKSD